MFTFTLLAYDPEQIDLLHYTYMFHYNATVTSILTPHQCTYICDICKLLHVQI